MIFQPPHTHTQKNISVQSQGFWEGGGEILSDPYLLLRQFFILYVLFCGGAAAGGGVNWNIPPQFLFTVAFIAYSKIYGYPPKKQTRGGATKINFAFEIKLNIFCSLGVKRQKIIIILTVLNDVSAPASVEASVRRV